MTLNSDLSASTSQGVRFSPSSMLDKHSNRATSPAPKKRLVKTPSGQSHSPTQHLSKIKIYAQGCILLSKVTLCLSAVPFEVSPPFKECEAAGRWWRTPLMPALGRQRQADLCEFQASLVYRVSSRTGSKATERNPVSL